jgi:hypothetical protein
MSLRWSGFAHLSFSESAWLAFARAAELAETDIHEQHQDAWIIDDRHIAFALETESGRGPIQAMQRFLDLLVLQAEAGEARIEIAEPCEHWVRRAAQEEDPPASEGMPESRTIRAGDRGRTPSGRAIG